MSQINKGSREMNTIKQIENSKISEMTDRELEDIMRKLPTYLSDITDEHLELYLAVGKYYVALDVMLNGKKKQCT